MGQMGILFRIRRMAILLDPRLRIVEIQWRDGRKPVTGHARRGEEQTGWDVSVKRPGCRASVSPGSECKNPLILLNFGGLARNQGVQKQALCL
ncbi:hypothetical protein AL522_00425 (plasmid) [Pantoea vagans]|nr:hypothetical protein AL522_00425 [Pantoea vagans]